MSPEFALVAALETAPGLAGKVSALQPPKAAAPPFAFYIPAQDSEEECLDGPSGLQRWSGALHLVAGSFAALQVLAARARLAVLDMRGRVYRTPEADVTDELTLRGAVLIETTETTLSAPDLYEAEVGLYRRIYTVRLDYQTENVNLGEEVISG